MNSKRHVAAVLTSMDLFTKSSVPVAFILLVTLAVTLSKPSLWAAQTISAKRIAATQRFIPLTKITIGPDDQYDGSTTADGSVLLFTRKADLISRVHAQDLKTGTVLNLLPVNYDSSDAAPSPDGRIAFTFFKASARGDICYGPQPTLPLKSMSESDIHCLVRPVPGSVPGSNATSSASNTQRSNPFWVSSHEIGFLEREVQTNQSRVVIQNIKSNAARTLVEGRIWSPAMRLNGRYLAYNEIIENKQATGTQEKDERRLTLLDLTTNKKYPVLLDLPGITGFPAFSFDEGQLYFSHYLNDTNSDRAIDGTDNGVVFRLPIAKIVAAVAGTRLFPEQLTSAETSCSFPRLAQRNDNHDLYVTCAFEGSLDIYKIPDTGIIPQPWDSKRLANALQTSRSYQDRILLFNTLRSRTPTFGTKEERDFSQRLFSNHLFADDTVASRFYLQRLADSNQRLADRDQKLAGDKQKFSDGESEKNFWGLIQIILEAHELKMSQSTATVTREFRGQLERFEARAQKLKTEPRLHAITIGLLRMYGERLQEAEKFLRQSQGSGTIRPLELYMRFELANQIYRRDLPRSLKPLLAASQEVMKSPGLTTESQLYYAVSALRMIQDAESRRPQRLSLVTGLQKNLSGPVATLVQSENAILRLIEAPDDKKMAVYKEIDQMMSQTRADYFLRKALYIRAITNLAQSADFKYLTLIATNWLRYTAGDDTEFIYAREVFADMSLDHAYSNLAKGKLDFAGNYFFESISLTDDLESHAGYVRTRLAKDQRKILDERYKDLKKREFVSDNMKFVHAITELLEPSLASKSSASRNNGKSASTDTSGAEVDIDILNSAIEQLEAMTQDRDSAVRHLLLGYCYFQKMLLLAKGPEFDQNLFQKSHYSLMLAYDLGRDNQRVKASALTNLGLLHQRVQNAGLSARFFALRKSLGFTSPDEQAQQAWLAARSFGRGGQAERAAQELKGIPKALENAPILERQAFYSMLAGEYKEAAVLYDRVLKTGQVTSEINQAKIHFGYGFTLFKLNEFTRAQTELNLSLASLEKLKPSRPTPDRYLDFHPARLQMNIYGYLSQMGSPAERAAALEKRIALVGANQTLLDDARSAQIQNLIQLAELNAKSDPQQALVKLNEALAGAAEYGTSDGFTSHAVFRTLVNYLSFGVLNPRIPSPTSDHVRNLVTQTIQAYDEQKISQVVLDYQKLKIQILWAAYTSKVLGKPENEPRNLDSLAASEIMKNLKEPQPEQWNDLNRLITALKR